MSNDGFDRVKKLLESYPAFRDSDNKLMAHVWREDLAYKFNVMNAHEFLVELATNNSLSSWGSITRYSRKVQELHPELRAINYIQKHLKEVKVIKELKEITSEFDNKFGYKHLPKEEGNLF